jgi:hypothetical protein
MGVVPVGIKITRKLLDDYRRLKREIPLLELELVEMLQGDNGFDNSTIFDYRTGEAIPQSVVGFDWKLRGHREKVLDGKKDKVKAVEKWIEAIEDGQTRCVFKMFYINGMTWDRIAAKTGYSNSPDYPRLHIRDDYLKKCQIK